MTGRFAALAWSAAGCTYALIVLGGVVRITGSGMACGEDWPLCRGRLLPTLDLPTLLEYGHRLAAAGVTVLVLGLAAQALRRRHELGVGGRGGLLRPALLAVTLLAGQVLLGAVTVRLALPPGVVSAHLVIGMTLLAALLLAAVRTSPVPAGPPGDHSQAPVRPAVGAASLAFLVVFLGGVVANAGAGPLCQGFPLCNGQLIPSGGALVHLHWTHRLLAYLLAIYVTTAGVIALRRGPPLAMRLTLVAALGLTAAQIGLAAAMVWAHLPHILRALHLAVGTAVWATLFLWAALARSLTRKPATGAPSL